MAPEEILSSADASRRDFLKKVLAGTTFAAPVIASFSMEGLTPGNAWAAASNQCFVANQTATSDCCRLALEITLRIVRFQGGIIEDVRTFETVERLVEQLDKARDAMIEGLEKGKGECVSKPAVDQFKKAAKEMDKFKRLVDELCGDRIDELTLFADDVIAEITNLVNGDCGPC